MKKLASILAVAMLVSLLSVPAFASPSTGFSNNDYTETVPTRAELEQIDPTDPESPDVVIVEDDTPLGEAEDVLGGEETGETTGETGETTVEATGEATEPAEPAGPQTYVKYDDPNDDPDMGPQYIPEEEVPLAELPADANTYITAEVETKDDGSVEVVISGDTLTSAVSEVTVDSGVITIDATTDNVSAGAPAAPVEITLTKTVANALSETKMDVAIATDNATVQLDSALLQAITDVDSDVILVTNEVSEQIPQAVKDAYKPAKALEFTLETTDGTKVEFNGGEATVTTVCEEDVNYAGYLVGDEIIEEKAVTKNADGTVSFSTTHFSTWLLYKDAVLETVSEEEVPMAVNPDGGMTTGTKLLIGFGCVLVAGGAAGVVVSRRKKADKA